MMGLAGTVSYVSELVMFFFVFKILEKTGCLLFMALGFFGYSIRFVVFAVMENPWIVMPFEVLQGKRAVICDFQQFDILTSKDSVEPLQPPIKLRNSKWCSVSSLTSTKYSCD